jgi:8-oxo-dGTP diphosphatase
MSNTVATLPILAAGAVCWRMVDGKARVLLVYRDSRKDVSLPKGKLDAGETLPQTAVREIAEETGLTVSLGAPLGHVEYTLPSGRTKNVSYWSAEVDEHVLEASRFTPNSEIAALEWVSLKKARKRLSYPRDLEILDVFAARIAEGTARTFALIVVRHAKAVPAESWDGPDATRPLLQRGTDQAASIAAGLAAYEPLRIFTSTAVRCVSTIEPVATLTGVPVKVTEALSQDANELGDAHLTEFLAKRVSRRQNAILCSHRPVLPDIVDEIARLTGTAIGPEVRDAAALATGDYSVIHIAAQDPATGIVAIETHGPATERPLT